MGVGASGAGALIARGTRWVTIAVFTMVGIAAGVGNEVRAQDVDPQFARVLVDRTIHFGGTFYQNGIHNKGPLEPFVYLVASWFTTSSGFWYAVSLFIALGCPRHRLRRAGGRHDRPARAPSSPSRSAPLCLCT